MIIERGKSSYIKKISSAYFFFVFTILENFSLPLDQQVNRQQEIYTKLQILGSQQNINCNVTSSKLTTTIAISSNSNSITQNGLIRIANYLLSPFTYLTKKKNKNKNKKNPILV